MMPENTYLPLAVLITCILFFVGVGIFVAVVNNQLVQARQMVKKAFADIDVLIRRRGDEIPKLVTLCKEWMKHEQSLLNDVTALRERYNGAKGLEEKIVTENLLVLALMGIFGKSEKYPELKANKKMLELQKTISAQEKKIAGRREFFNHSVTLYNTFLKQIPVIYFAKVLKFTEIEMLKTSGLERMDVKIQMDA